MTNTTRILIGLAAALSMGVLSHGPFGRGEAFMARLDAGAQEVVREAELPGVSVRLARNPLRRHAILAGPADRFQREGLGSLPGLDERMRSEPGMGSIEWVNPPS